MLYTIELGFKVCRKNLCGPSSSNELTLMSANSTNPSYTAFEFVQFQSQLAINRVLNHHILLFNQNPHSS